MQDNERTMVVENAVALGSAASRRSFLRALGLGGTVVLLPSVFAACDDATGHNATTEVNNAFNAARSVTLDLTSDVGIFRYSLIIEQLEQAFYTQLVNSSNFDTLFPAAADQEAIVDIRNDEYVHRIFIDTALGSATLPQLAFDFTGVFATRQTVLAAARVFNSTGVSALNGIGRYVRNANNLLVSGKIVSVEGRHGATLYDLDDAGNATGAGEATGRRFADLALFATQGFGADPANALDDALTPAQVVAISDPYVINPVAIGAGPT